MAETPDGSEKTEEPTAKKKSKARSEGQVPRSKEFTTLLTLLAAIIGMYFFAMRMAEMSVGLFQDNYILEREKIFDPQLLFISFENSLSDTIWALLPFLVLLAISGAIASIMIGGYNFSTKVIKPNFGKLNPLKGFKKIFGKQGLIELIKSALKISVLGTIAVFTFWHFKDVILSLYDVAFIDAFKKTMELIAIQFFIVSLGMIIIAAIDVWYQIYSNKEKLKMTKQEVKDETKNAEGNPEVKSRQRSIMVQQHIRRMMEAVPKADVVITNPTHYAVALKYDPDKGGAPVVVAKGLDLLALKIVQIAKGNDVMVVEVPPLARSIYYHTEVDQEIPVGLYVAVAQVLAYIYQIKQGEIYASTPFDGKNLEIPDELKK